MAKPSTVPLKPANENPWYILMTLFGEDDGTSTAENLRRREANQNAWNAWVGQSLNPTQLKAIQDEGLIKIAEFEREFQVSLVYKYGSVFNERNGAHAVVPKLPSPKDAVDLSRTEFSDSFLLEKMAFPAEVSFELSSFASPASFSESHFFDDFVLNSASFQRSLDAHNLRCEGILSAGNTSIAGDANFDGTRCVGHFSMNGGSFMGYTSFSNLSCHSGANFSKATFDAEEVLFNSARFRDSANFRAAVFAKLADFHSAIFFDHATFSECTFNGPCSFYDCTFKSNFYFRKTTCRGEMNFAKANFKDFAIFAQTSFADRTNFTRTVFSGKQDTNNPKIDFTDCEFKNTTTFRNTSFMRSFPVFSGTIFHPITRFSAENDLWPPKEPHSKEQAKDTCATIRHLLAKQGLPEDEHFFFRREMYFAGRIGSHWQRLPYLLFGWLSDYGHSIARPSLFLFGTWLAGAVLFLVAFAWFDVTKGEEWRLVQPFGFSFANMFKFLGFQRSYFGFDFLRELPLWLQFLSAVQTILGFVLLFFLGLGLRQRFRLR